MPGSVSGPKVTAIYDVPVVEKMTALVVPDGGAQVISWQLTDPNTGAPVDLTPYDDGTGAIRCGLRLKEATWSGGRYSIAATATAGQPIVSSVNVAMLGGPGIFIAQVAALDSLLNPAVINTFYLIVERSLWGADNSAGPLGLSEIRLHLRDSSPGENRLIDAKQFDDVEIARCIVEAVEYWNGCLPPLGVDMTTQSFPFRALWLQGTIAGLQKIAAEWYRKNKLEYQAGGVSVSDLGKADEYDRQADQAWAQFRADVQSRKVSINMESAWGQVSSPYGRVSGRYGR